ncbi:hypothetical protein AOQ84DRAFT_223606 [Glonium stellatum]|uniref:Uncharacterized protein n=1 Tax=Glonium stellatum TaxID=574774 RepID=A0A8E2EXG0_9PEZI|nr:hypothetical protein AOQ84DRAFT_223606 [Glonium stellatum]
MRARDEPCLKPCLSLPAPGFERAADQPKAYSDRGVTLRGLARLKGGEAQEGQSREGGKWQEGAIRGKQDAVVESSTLSLCRLHLRDEHAEGGPSLQQLAEGFKGRVGLADGAQGNVGRNANRAGCATELTTASRVMTEGKNGGWTIWAELGVRECGSVAMLGHTGRMMATEQQAAPAAAAAASAASKTEQQDHQQKASSYQQQRSSK